MSEIIWSVGMTLDSIEKMIILKAYSFFRHNKTQTAASLGISPRTLDNKLERYESELDSESERQANELRKRTAFLIKQRGNPPNNQGVPFTPTAALPGSHVGARMESFANAPEKPTLPVSERTQVQAMLSKNVTAGHKGKSR